MKSLSIPTLLAALLSSASILTGVLGDAPIDLGLAEPYAVLAGSTVTSTDTKGTVVTGNIGIYPGTALTGFPPGVLHGAFDAANGASGGAQGALTTAYNIAAGKAATATMSDVDLGGKTLLPGVYKFDEAAAMNGMLTLDAGGDASAIWTFQVGSSLLIAEGSSVIFKNSVGNPDYVYWQVGTTATLATGVSMVGNILALASVVVNDGATMKGRCLARNAAVTLDNSVITMPTMVSFSAKQTINGISLDTYNTDPDLNAITLKQAIAQAMSGVTVENVLMLDAQEGTTTARRALATTDSIVITYDVAVTSTLTSEELQAQLAAAVSDASFDSYLHAAALDTGASDLASATSSSVDTETIVPTTGDSSSDSSDNSTLSGGAIAGIVIGGVVALVLIALIIYYFTCHGGASAESHHAAPVSRQQV